MLCSSSDVAWLRQRLLITVASDAAVLLRTADICGCSLRKLMENVNAIGLHSRN